MTVRSEMPSIQPFSVGPVRFDNPLVLAPLSGITNLSYRRIAKSFGAGMVVSELVSSNGLVHASSRTHRYLATHPDEWPVVMQIFGDDPACMADAARIAQDAGAHVIDINIGCPVRKVVKRGAGCALMRDVPRSSRLISAVVNAVQVPVTIKIRAGWSASEVNAPDYAHMAESEGVQAVTVHGRTREQMFTGLADREVIRQTVERVNIPVIGNGDVVDAASATDMLSTGVAAVMIGRASQGNPWIFREILTAWQTGTAAPPPTPEERHQVICKHMQLYLEHQRPDIVIREMRKHICWYVKGLPESARFRTAVQQTERMDELHSLLSAYFDELTEKALVSA